jgi:ribonuclease HI
VILYTDGGARPNPGNSGWGAHGYLYTEDKPKKAIMQGYTVSSLGYIPKSDNISDVTVTKFFNFVGHTGQSTNNVSEINALYYSLEQLLKLEFTDILIFTDSEYLRRGITEWSDGWIKNNWKRSDGNEIINKEEWTRLLEVINKYKELNIVLNIEWVKGHSDNLGNNIANDLATIGVHSNPYVPAPYADYRYYEAKDYWGIKPERHPYMSFKRLFFNSQCKDSQIGYYFLEDSDKPDKYLGKKYSNTSYSVIKLYEPDQIIEAIRQKQSEISNGVNAVIMLKLDKVYEPEVYQYLKEYGKYCLSQPKLYDLSLNYLDAKPITVELIPPGLSLRAMGSFSYMEDLLNDIINSKNKHTLVNITDQFFSIETNTKNKTTYTLLPTVKVGVTHMLINTVYNDKPIKINLELGLDMLPRNNLKKLEPYQPMIHLILIKESEQSYRYMVLITSTLGIGIWSNYYSDQIFFS